MKKLMKSVVTLTLAATMLVAGSVTAFAARGNGNGARLQDGSCGNVCVYDGECPYDCDGTGLRDGSCGGGQGTGRGNGGTGRGMGAGGMRLQDGSCYQ